MDLVEQVNVELEDEKSSITPQVYSIIRKITNSMTEGVEPRLVFLVMPGLEEMVASGDKEFVLVSFQTGVLSLSQVKYNTCCVVSVILPPEIKRLIRGNDIALERGLLLTVINPQQQRVVGKSGYRTFSGVIRRHTDPEWLEEDLRQPTLIRTDAELTALAQLWLTELPAIPTTQQIRYKVASEARELALEPEAVDILQSKLTRMAFGIGCYKDDRGLAENLVSRLSMELFQKLPDDEIEQYIREKLPDASGAKRRRIKGNMLAIKYGVECDKELTFQKLSESRQRVRREKSEEKGKQYRFEHLFISELLVSGGDVRDTLRELRNISNLEYFGKSEQQKRIIEKLRRGFATLKSSLGRRVTAADIDQFIDRQSSPSAELSRAVKDLMKNML